MTTEHAAAHFEPDASSAAKARRFVATTLEAWQCSEVEEAVVLLVSELVGNTVLHAGTEIDVVVEFDGRRIRVEVSDASPVLPRRKRYSATSATGRGLALVERLSERWGAERSGPGKIVWFELDASSPEAEQAAPAAVDLGELEALGGWSTGPDGASGADAGGPVESPGARAESSHRMRHPVGVA
jgi:anti-sigma regulatory factor (Ser/Thr protein kinase)